MDLLSALLTTRISNTPFTVREFRKLKRVNRDIDQIIYSYIELNKADIKYDREILTEYWKIGGNNDNVVHGMILAAKQGKLLLLSDAISADKQGVDLVDKYMIKDNT